MNFILERIADPGIEPVTLAEAIQQVREFASIDQAAQDELTRLIVNAREWVEDETGQACIDQTWRLEFGIGVITPAADQRLRSSLMAGTFGWSDQGIYLRRTPVLAITKFATVADDGTETTVDAATYEVRDADSKWPRVVPLTGAVWTGLSRTRIEFRAGYADRTGSPTQGASVVPARLKQAILLHVEAHYDRDEKMMDKLLEAACNNVARLVAHVPLA